MVFYPNIQNVQRFNHLRFELCSCFIDHHDFNNKISVVHLGGVNLISLLVKRYDLKGGLPFGFCDHDGGEEVGGEMFRPGGFLIVGYIHG